MDDYYDFQQSFNYQLIRSNLATTPITSPPPKTTEINFNFSFEFQVNQWILGDDGDYDEAQLVSQHSNPVIDYLVSLSFDQFATSTEEETRMFMQEKLSGLPVDSDEDRLNLVKYAIHKAGKRIEEFRINYPVGGARYQALDLHFNVLLEHEYFYLGEIPISSCNMVPAKDSSINALKNIPATKEYSGRNMDCSICLESLFSGEDGGGGDCYHREALSMPCSHVFHGDCITNWLRVSHYCPLCRFEMPID